MTVLLTGGAGFLGRRILRALLSQEGVSVRCHVRSTPAEARLRATLSDEDTARVECVTGSLLSDDDCGRLVQGCHAVVHAAAAKSGSPSVLFLNTVSTTRILTRAVVAHSIPRLVLVSSLGVYGTAHLRNGDVLTEVCPVDPKPEERDGYSFAKIAQESVCRSIVKDSATSLVVIRPGVIFGPGGDLLSGRVGLRVGSMLVVMGGRHRMPYTYVDNCADAIALAVSAPRAGGETFNVLDDELPIGRALARIYSQRVERLRIVTIPRPLISVMARCYEAYCRFSDDMIPPILTRYRCNAQWKPLKYPNAKAVEGLGWTPRVGLPEAIDRTVASLSSSRRGRSADSPPPRESQQASPAAPSRRA